LLGVLFFVVAYSLKGLRFKEIPLLDSVSSSIHFVGPLIFAVAALGFPPSVWPVMTAFFLWGMASHAFGAVQDIIPDRAARIHSVATALGARVTVWLSVVLYALAGFVLVRAGGALTLVGLVALVYLVNVLWYGRVTDRTSGEANKGWRVFLVLNYLFGAFVTIVILLNL
jgi:4-hydroxybenzoate polyprenyltransferase